MTYPVEYDIKPISHDGHKSLYYYGRNAYSINVCYHFALRYKISHAAWYLFVAHKMKHAAYDHCEYLTDDSGICRTFYSQFWERAKPENQNRVKDDVGYCAYKLSNGGMDSFACRLQKLFKYH